MWTHSPSGLYKLVISSKLLAGSCWSDWAASVFLMNWLVINIWRRLLVFICKHLQSWRRKEWKSSEGGYQGDQTSNNKLLYNCTNKPISLKWKCGKTKQDIKKTLEISFVWRNTPYKCNTHTLSASVFVTRDCRFEMNTFPWWSTGTTNGDHTVL